MKIRSKQKSPGCNRGFSPNTFERTTTNEFNRIDDSRQIGGETMTIRTRRDDANYRSLNNKDWQGDSKKRINPRSTPALPASLYVQLSSYRWSLAHYGVTATLSYKWLEEMWMVEFDTPGIGYLQFDRDEPVLQMREKIIKAIDKGTQ